jgi:hypothetical protein
MPVDTFFAYCGVCTNVEDALADCHAVHAVHSETR